MKIIFIRMEFKILQIMMKFIDEFLNKITMYRLVLYYLIFLLLLAVIFSFFKILSFNPIALIFSIAFLTIVSQVTNVIFAKTFKAVTNLESVYISALILALLITPAKSAQDIIFLIWAGVLAMASKYIFAWGKKHIFNPVAFSMVLMALAANQSASWWVGTAFMMPFVLAGGLLIVRKTKRGDLIISFLIVALLTILGASLFKVSSAIIVAQKALFDSPILFFAFVMLTEPLTTPPTKILQRLYGTFVGFLFAPQIHFGAIYTTPEIALVVGNIFSYIVSPKEKLIINLKEKLQIAPDVYDFLFKPNKKLAYVPGQYFEWTLPQKDTDSRGNRRYFTIASSPTEEDLRIGVKFYQNPSSFKKSLGLMSRDSQIVASQLAGEFTLPKDPNKKLVFIAGGIGITPFRSMIKYLLDTHQSRPIVLFYSNKSAQDIVYADIFEKASRELGIKTVYTLVEAPQNWQGKTGLVSEQMIREEVPDYLERKFYISGPHSMVTAFEETLKKMGIKRSDIKVDFFPGFV